MYPTSSNILTLNPVWCLIGAIVFLQVNMELNDTDVRIVPVPLHEWLV